MPEPQRVPAVLRSPPFARLEREARLLRTVILSFGLVVAMAPPVFFAVLETNHLRREAQRLANQYVLLVHARARGQNVSGLPPQIPALMRLDGASSVRLLSPSGVLIESAGQPLSSWLSVQAFASVVTRSGLDPTLEVEVDGRPLVGKAGRVLGIHVLVAVALTLALIRLPVRAVRRAAFEVEASETRLLHSEKLRTLGEMYASLTHEINNPLAIILVRTKLLLGLAQQGRLAGEVVCDLEAIHRQGTRIASIVRSLLAFSRRTELEAAPTDLNDVVREVVELMEKPLNTQQIRVVAELASQLPPIVGSRDQLIQVFLNLVRNARDAMPGGGTLTLRTRSEAGQVVAEVEDTGTGIAESVRGRLFEPFATTKQVGEGVGLGLSVSYGIVSAHAGVLEAEDPPGGGALFRMRLPAGGSRS